MAISKVPEFCNSFENRQNRLKFQIDKCIKYFLTTCEQFWKRKKNRNFQKASTKVGTPTTGDENLHL